MESLSIVSKTLFKIIDQTHVKEDDQPDYHQHPISSSHPPRVNEVISAAGGTHPEMYTHIQLCGNSTIPLLLYISTYKFPHQILKCLLVELTKLMNFEC